MGKYTKKHKWKQSGGDTILVTSMTDKHITNTIKLIKRGGITGRWAGKHVNNWIQILESELNKRVINPNITNKLYKIY